MNGRQRNATNAQIWGKQNNSNYDGNCSSRHCLSGTYEISGRWIFVGGSVHTNVITAGILSVHVSVTCIEYGHICLSAVITYDVLNTRNFKKVR